MTEKIQGSGNAQGLKAAVVVSRFNSFITDRLAEGAREAFLRSGGSAQDLSIYTVPGALEIPVVCSSLIQAGSVDFIVALGAIVRGDTSHYDVVVNESNKGLTSLAVDSRIPIGNGILTVEDMDQAINRAGGKAGHKGEEAMLSAIETANLCKKICN